MRFLVIGDTREAGAAEILESTSLKEHTVVLADFANADRLRGQMMECDVALCLVSRSFISSQEGKWAYELLAYRPVIVIAIALDRPMPVDQLVELHTKNVVWLDGSKLATEKPRAALLETIVRAATTSKSRYLKELREQSRAAYANVLGRHPGIQPIRAERIATTCVGDHDDIDDRETGVTKPQRLTASVLKQRMLEVFSWERKRQPHRSPSAFYIYDLVQCGAFASPVAHPGKSVLIQALLYRHDLLVAAIKKARQAELTTRLHGVDTLEVQLPRGGLVELSLEAPQLRIPNPNRQLRWDGQMRAVSWTAGVRKNLRTDRIPVAMRVKVKGLEIARIEFNLPTVGLPRGPKDDADAPLMNMEISGTAGDTTISNSPEPIAAVNFATRNAFISYARADHPFVATVARVLESVGIDVFVDTMSLREGEHWKNRLLGEIKKADTFFLVWSKHAEASETVTMEWKCALHRQACSPCELPRVIPMAPCMPVPPLPRQLGHLHFDSRWLRWSTGMNEPLFDNQPSK